MSLEDKVGPKLDQLEDKVNAKLQQLSLAIRNLRKPKRIIPKEWIEQGKWRPLRSNDQNESPFDVPTTTSGYPFDPDEEAALVRLTQHDKEDEANDEGESK